MEHITNTIVWEGLDRKSMECLHWQEQDNGYTINSQLTGVIEDVPFAIHYRIDTDKAWQVRHFRVNNLHNTAQYLELYSDTKGNWFDNDKPVEELAGCIDIDITLTPFTNTLPIRRIDYPHRERVLINVLYITLPAFTMEKVVQQYTKDHEYLYSFALDDFKAKLPVDENYFVTDYPGLFKRLYPRIT